MNIKRAKQEAINAIKTYRQKDENGDYIIPLNRQRPIVFMGPAGVGKTDIAKQVADELNIGFLSYTITHHTRQSAVGLPKITTKNYSGEEKIVTEYTMSEIISSIYDYMEENNKKEGILFIDEFNCASETLAATMLQFLQNKTFGMNSVPDGWKIILAGNPPEYNKSVKELDLVTMDRLRIINIVPDFEAWKEYALAKNIHPCILSYLSQKQSNFCVFSNDKNGRQLVTARGWEELSNTIYLYSKMGFEINTDVISQFINHNKIANEFANYYDLFNRIITNEEVDEILKGKTSKALVEKLINSSFDTRCSVIWILTGKLQAAAREYGNYTNMCDELHKLIISVKEAKSFNNLRAADVEKNSKAFLTNILNKTKTLSFEASYELLKNEFEALILKREGEKESADSMVTNILKFINTTFDQGGEMEIFLSSISVDKNIAKLLVETGNKNYLSSNSQFIENFKTEKISSRIRKIS